MGVRRSDLARLLAVALLVGLLALLAGCGAVDDPQNTFAAEGDVARKQRDILIFWVLGPAVAIFIIVQGLLIYAVIRFRRKREGELPAQVHGSPRLELAWTIAPVIVLLVIAVPTIRGIVDLGREPAEDALRVTVIGQQFVWEFQYPDLIDAEGNPLTVIGTPGEPPEMHIPVGREIAVTLEARDVIHSFWVPKLAGKLDAIPGRENRFWFNATEPGSFAGQCAEFCGLGHADMRLVVMAESEEDFQAWVTDQLEGGGAASSGSEGPEQASGGE